MKIENFEFIFHQNIHIEINNILLLGYKSIDDQLNAIWKPSADEWRNQQLLEDKDGNIWMLYEKK